MARIVALYPAPHDPAAFDTYYETKRTSSSRKMPRLRSIELSKGPVMSPTGGTYHRVGTLRFDSMEDLQMAVESPEGRATPAADLSNFATGERCCSSTHWIFEQPRGDSCG